MDRRGNEVIDPTRNVLDLVEAAVRRLNDLADATDRRLQEQFLSATHLAEARDRRQDDLRELEAKHSKELNDVRADYEHKLRVAESQRIDAIRTVDVGAVQRAAEVAAAAASTLATQVQVSADALRGQVSTTAQQAGVSLAAALEPVVRDIQELRKTQYEQQGQKAAQTEGRGVSQWAVGLAMGVVLAIVEVTLHFIPAATTVSP